MEGFKFGNSEKFFMITMDDYNPIKTDLLSNIFVLVIFFLVDFEFRD